MNWRAFTSGSAALLAAHNKAENQERQTNDQTAVGDAAIDLPFARTEAEVWPLTVPETQANRGSDGAK